MYYWINRILIVVILSSLFSCEKGEREAGLYPIDSLMDAQINFLSDNRAVLQKVALIGSTLDTTTSVPKDTLAWTNELDIFRQLEAINKPLNRSSYLVDDNLYDPRSNLTVKSFTSLDDLPVKSLRVFYATSVKSPRRIEAVFHDKNALYESSRTLSLTFEQVKSQNTLTSYSIQGGQKIILGDTVAFQVKGDIQIK